MGHKADRSTGAKARVNRSPATTLAASLVAVVVVYVLALGYLAPGSPGRSMPLSELARDASCAGPQANPPDSSQLAYCTGAHYRVTSARFLDRDARIVWRAVALAGPGARSDAAATPTTFWTAYPSSDTSTNDLLRTLYVADAQVTVDSQSTQKLVQVLTQFVLPLVILALLFALLFNFISGAGGSNEADVLAFGGAGDKRQRDDAKAKTTFANVAGADETIAELAEVRDYLADPSAFAAMGARPPKGVLLAGPPGCGKTLLARAVAGEAAANFYSMAGSEFVEALVGVGAARVRDLFAQARAHPPSLIFIDELDAVARQRGAGLGQGHDEREQTLNELLVQMDGFSPAEGVVVMAATNRPDILDPALLRAGRFDRHITVERPDLAGRLAILRIHAWGKRLADPQADLEMVAANSAGFSGADLANVLNEAALLTVRERATTIGRSQLEEAVERVLGGPKLRAQVLTAEDKARIAVHEAGHAVVAAAVGKGAWIRKLSVVARGRGVGHLAMLGDERTMLTAAHMADDVAVAMAGYAAEELVLGAASTGSEADVERATHTARDMAGRYGMSERLGPVRLLGQDREVFLGRDYLQTRDVSQPTLEHLDAEVRRIVDSQKDVAQAILRANREVLDALTSSLARHETLRGAELTQILSGVNRIHADTGADAYRANAYAASAVPAPPGDGGT